jgi:hypothetical protein
MPRAAAVMTGGPSSSGPAMPPCAYALEYQSPSQIAATIADRAIFVDINIPRIISSSEGFDVTADRPDRQIPADELSDPISDRRKRAAE